MQKAVSPTISSTARAAPTPIPAFAPVLNPLSSSRTLVKFDGSRRVAVGTPVSVAEAQYPVTPPEVMMVQRAPLRQQPSRPSSHGKWFCAHWVGWMEATGSGGSGTNSAHVPSDWQKEVSGQQPPFGPGH